jgi:hypothetical protein
VSRSISKKLRFDVFKRDRFVCQYCGTHPPEAVLEVDHIIAVASGGTDDPTNLITACLGCNRGKGASSLSEVPVSLAERSEETAEREAQIAGYEAVMRERRARIDRDAQRVLDEIMEFFPTMSGIPTPNFISIKRFVESIGLDSTLESVNIAVNQGPDYYEAWFRYFCGVCWRKVREAGQ